MMFGLWILLLLTSLKTEVMAAAADSITDDQIKDYLINYLDNCKYFQHYAFIKYSTGMLYAIDLYVCLSVRPFSR